MSFLSIIYKVYLFRYPPNRSVALGGIQASLELVTSLLRYDLYLHSHPYTELFGIEDPCYGLSASGDSSSKLDDTFESVRTELPLPTVPFQDLKDACRTLFNLDFGTFESSNRSKIMSGGSGVDTVKLSLSTKWIFMF